MNYLALQANQEPHNTRHLTRIQLPAKLSLLTMFIAASCLLDFSCPGDTGKFVSNDAIFEEGRFDTELLDQIDQDSFDTESEWTQFPPVDLKDTQQVCKPLCAGKACGPDGCGGTCGECDQGFVCHDGKCVEAPHGCQLLEECLPWVCDPQTGVCTGCKSNSDCQEVGMVCDATTGKCVECTDSSNCEPGYECIQSKCKATGCPAIPCPEGTVCDDNNQVCVECLDDSDCSEGTICDTDVGECVECLTDKDCPSGQICAQGTQTCEQCIIDKHCPVGFECINKKCVALPECQSNADCPDSLVCEPVTGKCVECIEDFDCKSGYICDDNHKCKQIVECTSDADCLGQGKVCDMALGKCVECVEDADCDPQDYCDNQTCQPDVCSQNNTAPQCQGNKVVKCADNGSKWIVIEECKNQEICQNGACAAVICTPKQAGCDDNIAFVCNDTGTGYDYLQNCAELNQKCYKGSCMAPVCEPDSKFCLTKSVAAVCTEDGFDYEQFQCATGEVCLPDTGVCTQTICEPGVWYCIDQVASRCNQYGTGYDLELDCGSIGLYCAAGECIVCVPKCQAKECGSDGCGGSCGECGTNEVCIGGECVDYVCPDQCTGKTVDAFVCGLDLCYPDLVGQASIYSPSNDNIQSAWDVVAHFGSPNNDLAPRFGPSYSIISTGNLNKEVHSTNLPGGNMLQDAYAAEPQPTFDNLEFTVTLTAPSKASGFSVDYIFLSVEYEEYIGSKYNDKFYIFMTAPVTTEGKKIVINYTECAEPNTYWDFLDPSGKKWCYIDINSKLSESCENPTTDISGTGFECGNSNPETNGSSTGWLRTSWPIYPGETFTLIFHIHDTGDAIFDSAVILDNFQWIVEPTFVPGTIKLQ